MRFNRIWSRSDRKKVANIERVTPETRSRARGHTRVAECPQKKQTAYSRRHPMVVSASSANVFKKCLCSFYQYKITAFALGYRFELGFRLGFGLGLGLGLRLGLRVSFFKLYIKMSARMEHSPSLFHFSKNNCIDA